MSGKKLYVGSLSYGVDDKKLRDIFAEVGTIVSAKVIFADGRSKGFGFVEMAESEEAEKAIQDLNGTTHDGRAIVVSYAKPEKSRSSGGGGGGGRGSYGGGYGGGGGGGGGRDRGWK